MFVVRSRAPAGIKAQFLPSFLAACLRNFASMRLTKKFDCENLLVSYLTLAVPNLTPFVSGFSGGRVKQHPIANHNRHSGEAFGVRTTWGWVQ